MAEHPRRRYLPPMVRGFVPKPPPLTAVMTIPPPALPVQNPRAVRSLFRRTFVALFAGIIGLCLPVATGRAQPSDYEAEGEEVLTRGPVHEAFAAVVSYNPAPGIVVKMRPPELIEELPPEERPEGDDVTWIPGYWGWDDERNDYLWISGTWRVPPPGREWMAGYWRESDGGFQWISGYWADATGRETTYLPSPPASLETGPNRDAPSADYAWSPGSWFWQQDRYAWRAGYWAEGREDWVWVPAYYVWTPRGAIFVEGFWDYPVGRRGILFAPVYYRSHGYARRGYSYSPRIAINLVLFQDNLFLRPRYHHYYFGDYYGSRYEREGFFASISFQSSRQGFDPFYAHNRWEHRSDRGWENRFQASYRDRRDHEAARPPRTWSAQLKLNAGPPAGGQVRVQLAVPLEQLARRPDNPGRFQTVAPADRQNLAQRGREVQQLRDQRRTVEAKAAVTGGRSAAAAVEPVRVAAPRSPIVARPSAQPGRDQAPPARPQAQPRAEDPGRPPAADRRNAPAENRQPDPRPPAGARSPQATEERRNAAADKARDDSQRKEQLDAERRNRETEARTQAAEKSRQAANEAVVANKPQADQRRDEVNAKAREEAQQQAQQDAEKRNHDAAAKSQAAENEKPPAQERVNDSARKVRDEAQQRAGEAQARSQQEGERADAAAARARNEAPRKEQPAPTRAQPDGERRGREAAQPKPTPNDKPPANDKSADDENDDARKDKPRR